MISEETKSDLNKAELPAEVSLFELDISKLNKGGSSSVWLFCNEKNELDSPVVWRGKKFIPIPIEFSGADKKVDGPSTRPTLTVGNVDGYMTGAIAMYGGLVGAKVTRYRVRANHLDAVNFENGNPTANPNEYVADSYIINRPESYNKHQATFELALPTETDGASLPNRTILASICPFKYRGTGCGYDGHAVADINGYALEPHEMDKDQCDKTLAGCQRVFGINGKLPFGGFPMADKVAR